MRLLVTLLLRRACTGRAPAQRDPLDAPRFVTVSDSRRIGDQVATALGQEGEGRAAEGPSA